MKSDNPVFQIVSLLLMFGPIVLFWYIDWYWIVGYYNLFFTYTCYVLYKQYDSDSNYRKKYHFIVYVGLPLIFSFIGLLISVINGFEEIKEGDKDFNKNKFKTNDEGFSIQNDSNTSNKITEHSTVESNKEFKSAINNIDIENLDSFNVDIILSKWSTYEEVTYEGDFEGYGYKLTGGIANKWTKHLGCYTNNLEGFLSDVGDNELYQLDSKLKYDSTNFDEEPDYTFIEKINWNEGTPKNIKEEIEENYSSNDYEKLISKTNPNATFGDIEFFNKEQSNLFQIIIKYEQGGLEKSIIWSDTEHEEGKCRDCKCEVKSHLRFCESCEDKRIKTLDKIDKTLAFLDKISPDKDDNASSNKNKVESKNDIEPKQNVNKPETRIGKVKELILDFQDVRKLIVQLKENKTPIKFRSIWENYFYYQLKDESQKDFTEESDHWDILDEYLETYGLKKDYDKSKKLHYSYITYIEEIEIDYDQFIEESAIQDYIEACEKNNKNEYKGWVQFDYSYDDYLSWTVEEDFYNDPAAPGWLNSDKSDLIAPLNINDDEIKTEFNLNYKPFEDVIDFNFSEVNFKSQNHLYVFDNKFIANDSPRNEKDLIQELGRIHDLLGHKEYKKEAYNLWRDFFLKKYDESEEKDGWEIGQEANSVMFDMYEVDFVSFFLNNKESGDTETMNIRFPFKILENGKAALIYNFPFKYDQITSHSSGSFYQLDDVWGSLNEVCKSLSELELLDINKLSQVQKNELFTPQRKDYT